MRKESSPCFIFGIAPRSGTNFLFGLLRRHPECDAGSFGELALFRHSALLVAYAERVVTTWADRWVENGTVSIDDLLGALGHGLSTFLLSGAAASTAAEAGPDLREKKKILLTKTPDVRGLANFRRLFPEDSRAILLVRDGRGVVESAGRSFGWSYEYAMQRWAAGAAAILDAAADGSGPAARLLIVKYEDLVKHQSAELRRIFEFFNLDPDKYDYASAQEMGVIGSSELRRGGESVHWREVDKPSGFDPLNRFDGWTPRRRLRFAWVAGKKMEAFGYPLDTDVSVALPWRLWQMCLDLRWRSAQWALMVMRPVAWRLWVILKRRQRRRFLGVEGN